MDFISFVSEAYLIDFTPLNGNIDAKELLPHLQYTELNYVREIVGKWLYDDLKAKFIAQTLNSDEITLVSMLKETIAYRCAEQALPFLSMKIRNSGAVKLTGSNFQPATTADMKYLGQTLKQRAEYFEERINQYLCDNSDLFPLYKFSIKNNPSPNVNIGFSNLGIYLGSDVDLKRNRYLYGE